MTVPVHDLLVVGAGPAGAAATLTARRLAPGASVAVVDRAAFPRDKPCGDGLSDDAVAELARLGVGHAVDGFAPVSQIRLRAPAGRQVTGRPPAAAYVIPRLILDDRLARAARRAASHWARATVRGVVDAGTALRVDTGDAPLYARTVIAADGANSAVARAAGARTDARHAGVAIRAYAPAPADAPELLLIWEQQVDGLAYAWSFPIDQHRCNVGYGVFARAPRAGRARLQRRLETLLPHGSTADPASIRGHRLPLSSGGVRLGSGRVLLAGDAASLINPITGEGIYYALLSGRLAAQAAMRSPGEPLRSYRAMLRQELGAHIRSTRWLARLARTGTALDHLVGAATRSPATMDLLADLAFGKGALTPMSLRAIAVGMWHARSSTGDASGSAA